MNNCIDDSFGIHSTKQKIFSKKIYNNTIAIGINRFWHCSYYTQRMNNLIFWFRYVNHQHIIPLFFRNILDHWGNQCGTCDQQIPNLPTPTKNPRIIS